MYSNHNEIELSDLIIREWKIRNDCPSSSDSWYFHENKCHEIGNELRERYNWKNEDFTQLYMYNVGDDF